MPTFYNLTTYVINNSCCQSLVISHCINLIIWKFQAKALGRVLFDQVCKQLHLLEADYFGLEYQEPNFTKVRYDS